MTEREREEGLGGVQSGAGDEFSQDQRSLSQRGAGCFPVHSLCGTVHSKSMLLFCTLFNFHSLLEN